MKNFILGIVSGLVMAALALLLVFIAVLKIAGSFSGDKAPKIAEKSTLVLRLEGGVPEKPPTEVPLPFLEDQSPLSTIEVWSTFRRAADDPKIKAILFEPRALGVGWARLQEIREELLQFKKSGKPVVAFLRSPGTKEYYLASAADKIYLAPEDELDVKGLRVESMFVKDGLDKIGVKMDVIHAGKYKDAGDMFTQNKMTPETREVLNAVLDQFFGDLVNAIAQGRKRQPGQVRELIDQGPFLGDQALAAGLVDVLGFEDQATADLAKMLNQNEIKRLAVKTYIKAASPEGGKKIALIVGEGEIHRGSGTSQFGGEQDGIYSGSFSKLLHDVETDSSIQGAILRVNSPGGDAIASDDILHAAKLLSAKKPVVISMGDLAASGGYFISMTGDPIVAYPNTLTGSIGVIMVRPNLHGLYDKLGVQRDPLSRGRFSGLDSDYEQLTDDTRAKLRSQIDAVYKGFVDRVAAGRKQPFEKMEALAQGRVWLGAQAKQNGLVDELGGLDRAIELVKQKAKIKPGEKVSLVQFPPKRSLLEMLSTKTLDESANMDAAIDAKIQKLTGIPAGIWREGGLLKVMPYPVIVR